MDDDGFRQMQELRATVKARIRDYVTAIEMADKDEAFKMLTMSMRDWVAVL